MFFSLKVVIHLTDGLDAPYAEMKRRVEELRLSGKKNDKVPMDLRTLNLCETIAVSY